MLLGASLQNLIIIDEWILTHSVNDLLLTKITYKYKIALAYQVKTKALAGRWSDIIRWHKLYGWVLLVVLER